MTIFKIKRSLTPGNSPPANSLAEGELAVDMAVAPRLWVGVPPAIDATGMVVVSDMSQAGGGLDQATADGLYANIAGDTFTGPVLLAGPPTLPLHAATMAWVESVIGAAGGGTITGVTAGIGLTGGGVTGSVTLSLTAPVTIALGGTGAIDAATALTNLGGLDKAAADLLYLPLTTDLFTQAEADLLYMPIGTVGGTPPGGAVGDIQVHGAGGVFGGVTVLPVASGGTGATTFTDIWGVPEDRNIVTAFGTTPLTTSSMISVNDALQAFSLSSFTTGGAIYFNRSHGGTAAAPTAILSDDQIGAIAFDGFDGAVWAGAPGRATPVNIYVLAAENWSATATGACLTIQATPNGVNIPVEVARFQGGVQIGLPTGGDMGAGTLNAAGLFVNGVAVGAGGTTPPGGAVGDIQLHNAGGVFGGVAVLPITSGGTGAITAPAALTALGGLDKAAADLLYLPIGTDLFTQAEADLRYVNISTGDYLTQTEGDARYLQLTADLFTQADADLLYLPIATDLFTQTEGDARYLGLAGGTLTGALVLAGPPTLALHAATMAWVESVIGAAGGGTITGVTAGAGLTGGGTTGVVTVSLTAPVTIALGGTNAITAAAALTNLGGLSQAVADTLYLPIATDLLTQVEADARYLGLAGGTLTGALVLAGPPTLALHAATMAYVDAQVGGGLTQAEADLLYLPIGTDLFTQAEADALFLTPAEAGALYLPIGTDLFTQADADLLYLPLATDLLTQAEADARYLGLAGGTLTGALVLAGPPTLALHAATMAYVDAQIGGGLTQAEADLLYLPIGTDLFTQAEADALFLTPAEAGALYLPIATDLFTQAEADLLYMPIATDFLTQAEGDARYLPLTTDLLTQAEADALFLTPAEGNAAYLPIATDLFTQAEADVLYARKITIADLPPAAPVVGDLWFDSANVRLAIYYNDGTSAQWVTV